MSSQPRPLSVFSLASDFVPPVANFTKERVYSFYGPVSISSLVGSAADFISAHSSVVDESSLVRVLASYVDSATQDAVKNAGPEDKNSITESCWLTIRITKPCSDYVLPRWHRDGRMFNCTCTVRNSHSKYAATILGPATLLLNPSAEVDEILLRTLGSTVGNFEENRSKVATALAAVPRVPVRTGQLVRFSWGQSDSPVHSEPDSSSSDRIFMSILFGSEGEIREMFKFRDEQYGITSD